MATDPARRRKAPAVPAPYDGDPAAARARAKRLRADRAQLSALQATLARLEAVAAAMEDRNEEFRRLVAMLDKHGAAHASVQALIRNIVARIEAGEL